MPFMGSAMFSSKKKNKRNLYYLLPGMARSNRRRHRQILAWSILFGAIFAAIFGLLLYYFNAYRFIGL